MLRWKGPVLLAVVALCACADPATESFPEAEVDAGGDAVGPDVRDASVADTADPSPDVARDTPAPDAPNDASGDAREPPDAPVDAGEPDTAPDAEADVTPDMPQPVDCDGIEAQGFALCRQTHSTCEAVFTDQEGCAAVCAAAGLVCGGVLEDLPGECAPDAERPALTCDPATGHMSDYCVCQRPDDTCTPTCPEGFCGSDGCGGLCGCGRGESCQDSACVEDGPDCDGFPHSARSLLAELQGFGRRATGGDPDNIYRVTTRSNSGAGSLRRALESDERYWVVFDIGRDGNERINIDPDDPIDIKSHKTIDGRGRDVTINGNMRIRGQRNIIISDVALTNQNSPRCTQEHDVVTVTADDANRPGDYDSRDIWLHHCELYDGGDGLFDIRGGSRVTLSWNYWHDHFKAVLIGVNGQRGESEETEVTFHHNYFERITKRHPRMHYARVHAYNNYYFEYWEYAVSVADDGEFRSEGNIYQAREGETCGVPFIGCQNPAPCGDMDWEVFKEGIDLDREDGHGRGKAVSIGDLLVNEATVEQAGTIFTPDYSYEVEVATPALAEHIRQNAGRRPAYCR
jgi:pectate lyase